MFVEEFNFFLGCYSEMSGLFSSLLVEEERLGASRDRKLTLNVDVMAKPSSTFIKGPACGIEMFLLYRPCSSPTRLEECRNVQLVVICNLTA